MPQASPIHFASDTLRLLAGPVAAMSSGAVVVVFVKGLTVLLVKVARRNALLELVDFEARFLVVKYVGGCWFFSASFHDETFLGLFGPEDGAFPPHALHTRAAPESRAISWMVGVESSGNRGGVKYFDARGGFNPLSAYRIKCWGETS